MNSPWGKGDKGKGRILLTLPNLPTQSAYVGAQNKGTCQRASFDSFSMADTNHFESSQCAHR